MSLIAWGLRLLGRGAWQELERATRAPRQVQEQLFRKLIGDNQDTAFGRDHGFPHVRTIGDYRAGVPIAGYEQLRPYVERVINGEPDALTAEQPEMFTLTSGTTGQPKYIPVTPSAGRASARLTRAWLYRALVDHPRFLDGRMLAVVSPDVEGYTPGGIPYGSASGRIYRDNTWIVQRAYAVPYPTFTIKDYDAKYYAIARFAIETPVTFIGTPNPSTLVRLAELGDRYREEIIQDIHDGSLSRRLDIAPEVRRQLDAYLRPNPSRARALEQLVETHGALRPCDYWPDLRLVGCWKGGAVGVQLDRSRPWYGPQVATRDLGYLASEAHMSVPIDDEAAGGVLAITANLYEFIPEDEIERTQPQTLLCDEVEPGKTYYVLLTTPGGLYRYDINDVVRVTGFHNATPSIEFVRKGRDMTSLGGEKLHVGQLVEAVECALQEVAVACAHYRAVACAETNRYELLVECSSGPTHPPVSSWGASAPQAPRRGSAEGARPREGEDEVIFQHLLRRVDDHLGALNLEYRAKRDSGRLDPPCIHLMRAGWHERAIQRRLATGARDVQFKPVVLSAAFEDGEQEEILWTLEL